MISSVSMCSDSAWKFSRIRCLRTGAASGEVINVEFMNCPYDSEGREFVERALKKTPMPYSGFEPVFMRQVELSFCYQREDCER